MTLTEILPLIGGAAGLCSVAALVINARRAAAEKREADKAEGARQQKAEEQRESLERAWNKIGVLENGDRERAVQFATITAQLNFLGQGQAGLERTLRDEIKALHDEIRSLRTEAKA